MARTALTTQEPAQAGTVWTYEAAEPDGNMLDGGRSVLLLVSNTHATDPRAVTVQTAATVSGLDVADEAVVVAALTTQVIGPFDSKTFDRPAGVADPGLVYVDYSDAAADLEVAAIGRG